MSEQRKRVAVFIDGENIGHPHAKLLHEAAMDFGEVTRAQVYGGQSLICTWKNQDYFSLVTTPYGKNATDLIICVDMIEAACSGEYDIIVIGSGDKDYTYAVDTIRRRGLTVVGVCLTEPSRLLHLSCNRFVCLEDNYINAEESIRSYVRERIAEEGGLALRGFDSLINEMVGYSIEDVRAATWIDFFEYRAPEFKLVEKGPEFMIQMAPPKREPSKIVVPQLSGPFVPSIWSSSTALSYHMDVPPLPIGLCL